MTRPKRPRRPALLQDRALSDAQATSTGAAQVDAPRATGTLAQQWREQVDALQVAGTLDASQGHDLVAFLDQREAEIGVKLQGLQAEFYARRSRFGNDKAMHWLEQAMRTLRRDQVEACAQVGRTEAEAVSPTATPADRGALAPSLQGLETRRRSRGATRKR